MLKYEKPALESYRDAATGEWFIGYGHTSDNVKEHQKFSEDEALRHLDKDLKAALKCIKERIMLFNENALNSNQLSALVSLVQASRCSALQLSGLEYRLNLQEDPERVAKEEFPKFKVDRHGKASDMILKRRQDELTLFLKPIE